MGTNPTIETYDRYAQVYDDEVVIFWDEFPKVFVDKFVSALRGKRVLDVGSGSGRDAVMLRERGLEVVCVDACKSMVEMTTNLGFESHLKSFAEMDFAPQSFDGVWAYTSLIHVPLAEVRESLTKLHAMLKPGGALVFGAIEGDSAGMVERKTMPGMARYFKNYDRQELKEMIEAAGFSFVYEHDYQPHNSVYLNQLFTKSVY